MKGMILVVLAMVFLGGCVGTTTVSTSGPPTFVGISNDANPDVVWMVRTVKVQAEYDESKTLYALFACYRPPVTNPGPPVCYLAKVVADLQDLSWPGRVVLEDGVFKVPAERNVDHTGFE